MNATLLCLLVSAAPTTQTTQTAAAAPAAPAAALVAAPTTAPSAATTADAAALDRAADALARKDGEACGKLAQEALNGGTLTDHQTVRAWTLRGACYVATGQLEKAQRAYAVALRLQHDLPAVDDDAFRAARAELPPLDKGFAVRAGIVDGDVIEVVLVADDLGLAKACLLMHGEDELAHFPLQAETPRHRVSGVGTDGIVAVAVDKHGNTLASITVTPSAASAPSTASAAPATTPPAAGAPTILTSLGAGALGLGALGVVVSGVGLASLGPKAVDDGQLWMVGAAASGALFLVGASLVVVDQGLPAQGG